MIMSCKRRYRKSLLTLIPEAFARSFGEERSKVVCGSLLLEKVALVFEVKSSYEDM